MDGNDHRMLADWWCRVLGYVRREDSDEGEPRPPDSPVPIVDPTGAGPVMWVSPVPERKTVKNRMHIDIYGVTSELLRLGATLVRARGGDIEWDVLADPEGNEFCVFAER
jgi:Glyoxalase-like domain